MLKIVERFTTRDGEWVPSDKKYSISHEFISRYWAEVEAKGAASHLFVRADGGRAVRFYTKDGKNDLPPIYPPIGGGWVNFPMWKTSAYWPPNEGPWCVSVDGVEVATGLGLPEGFHVSTFLVVEDVSEQPIDGSGPFVGDFEQRVVFQDLLNGGVIKERILWSSASTGTSTQAEK